jgi:stage II sporulation protein D
MKSNVNSVLNSIIAVLVIGGIYTIAAVTGETSGVEYADTATAVSFETTLSVIEDIETEEVKPAIATVATSASRKYNFVTESDTVSSDTTASTETVPTTTAATTTITTTTTASETTTPSSTTTPPPTTTTVPTTTTKKKTATTTEYIELYEEDESDFDIDLFSEIEYLTTTTTTMQTLPDITWSVYDPSETTAAQSTEPSIRPEHAAQTLTARFNGQKQTVNAFGLVCAVTANEVSDSFYDEAIKAQAVAAYTYIKGCNDRGETPDVGVKYNYSDRIESLVESVWGIACYYDGKLAQTVYSASSAGYTASAENVWGGAHPYLVSVSTPFDSASDPNYGIKKTFTESQMRNYVESDLNIRLSDNPANWFVIASRIDGSYVGQLIIDGQKNISGREFRESVMDYNIRSSSFDIGYQNGVFTVTTYGYGHGVGMSQNGANILARDGYTYIQILKYYYTGIQVL